MVVSYTQKMDTKVTLQSFLPLSDLELGQVKLTSIAQCFSDAELIFIAIHGAHFQETLNGFNDVTRGKILVDVSNPPLDGNKADQSNAEKLMTILPQSIVVKSFNSVPAAAFDQMSVINRERLRVFVASDSQDGRAAVADVAKSMGFLVTDLGSIKSAVDMEQQVLKTFDLWKVPACVSLGVLLLWGLITVYRDFISRPGYISTDQIYLKVSNKPICLTAITMIALTYLPGKTILSK